MLVAMKTVLLAALALTALALSGCIIVIEQAPAEKAAPAKKAAAKPNPDSSSK
jgi:PBP1b-binding outer membrane lipoprotein LpoB